MVTYPYTIDNGNGECLTFLSHTINDTSEYVEIENCLDAGCGPPLHVHFLQEESLTVLEGTMGVQQAGAKPFYLQAGENIVFAKGTMHRFWNAGQTTLRCRGRITPALNVAYFLSAVFNSVKTGKNGRPDPFDMAYLLHRYQTEFGLGLPLAVKKIIFPVILFAGLLRGKHKKFNAAPLPVPKGSV